MRLLRSLVLVVVAASSSLAGDVPRPAPPLEVKTYDGRTINLEQLRGKVVAVMFFLTTCPHCQQTTQLLAPLYDQWKSRGLEILALAINPSASGSLRAFAERYNAKFPMALSMTSECNRFANASVMRRFRVPYLFLIDREGTIREERPGQDEGFWRNQQTTLRTSIDALLKEPLKGERSSS